MLKILDTIGIYSLSVLPVSGTAGEVAYYNGSFYGWTGSAWKSLNNDATTKFDVGLGNVNNTSDLAKPVSTATQAALDLKVSQGLIGLSGLTAASAGRLVGRRSDSAGLLEELTVGSGITLTSTALGLSAIPAATLLGNSTAGSAVPSALSATAVTALLNSFTASLKGLVPAPGSSTGRYLRDDGTWTLVAGTGGTAATTTFSPAGDISATDVQSAIQELDNEKSSVGHDHAGVYQPESYFLNRVAEVLSDAAQYSYKGNVCIDETGYISVEAPYPFNPATVSLAGTEGLVPAPQAGDNTKFLRGDGTWQTVVISQTAGGTSFTPYGNLVATNVQSAIQELDDEKVKTGPIVSSGLNMATARFLGRASASSGAIEELNSTSATAMLDTFGTTTKGLVPAPSTASGRFLRDDGSWAIPIPDFAPVFATGTGLAQNIELPISGLVPHQVLVFINGLRYRSTEYSISGTTLTVTTNAAGDDIEILRR